MAVEEATVTAVAASRIGRVASGKGLRKGLRFAPLFSNIYMRRFILGWKVLGYARRFEAEIVNYGRTRLRSARQGAGGRNAVGSRGPAAASEVAYQRREDPLLPDTRDVDDVSRYRIGATAAGHGTPTSAPARARLSVQSICRRGAC